jgi:multiple antibiotic resistance protein
MELTTELFGYVFLVVGTLIPIANPFSTAPMFLSLTANFEKSERKRAAKLSCMYMFLVLVTFLLFGVFILSFFGISLPSLKIAGGLIIGYIGFRMLFPPKLSGDVQSNANSASDIAFVPLAMPMLSGPGAISVVIAMAADIGQSSTSGELVIGYLTVGCGIAASSIICWMVLNASGKVVKFMGKSGIEAMTKVMSFFLISIGVEFLSSTVFTLLRS